MTDYEYKNLFHAQEVTVAVCSGPQSLLHLCERITFSGMLGWDAKTTHSMIHDSTSMKLSTSFCDFHLNLIGSQSISQESAGSDRCLF